MEQKSYCKVSEMYVTELTLDRTTSKPKSVLCLLGGKGQEP